MPEFDYDLFVIGAGSGGTRCARISAGHGARVGIAEDLYLGGTCVNVGCVPKKLMTYAAHFAHDFEDAQGYGWEAVSPRHDWASMIANKDREILRLNDVYRRLLENAGATIHWGTARLVDAHTIEVGEERVTAERIVIAVGGWPHKPPGVPGVEEYAITSNEAFYLKEMPKRVLVGGGGYIALEFAGIFNGLGAKVTQLYRGELFLRGFDRDVRECLFADYTRQGIDVRFNTVVSSISKNGDGLDVMLSDGSMIEVDCVMFAIGRKPKTEGLGLEALGVEMDADGAIIVDDGYRTSVPHIFALGDVTNRVNLTPVAIAEGHWLADTLFAQGRPDVIYDNIATAVFSSPAIGTVGLTEEEAREKGFKIDVYRSTFRPMKATMSGREGRVLMKLIVDRETDRVLGCHMVGDDAPEIMQGVSIAMTAGATKAHFDRTIGIHPTAAEEFVTMRTPVPDVKEFKD